MLIVCTWLRRVGGQRPWRLLKTESMGSNIGTGHLTWYTVKACVYEVKIMQGWADLSYKLNPFS